MKKYNFTVSKTTAKALLLSLLLIFTFRLLQNFPGMALIKELWICVLTMFAIFPYLIWKARSGWTVSPFELYILFMITLIPVWTGFTAWLEFGQPITFGVLAQRNNMLAIGTLMLMYGVFHRLITVRDVERSLVWLAWGTLFVYSLAVVMIDPVQFADAQVGFVSGRDENTAFKFNTLFIIFGFFYYGFKGTRRKQFSAYLFALMFLGYLVFVEQGRSLIVSVLGAFAFFVWRWGSFVRLFTLVPKLILVTGCLITLAFNFEGLQMSRFTERLGDAFLVVATGELGDDHSANSRIKQTLIALPYIEKNWLIGNGDISNHWHGGYHEILDGYFYPSDIGILGVIYMYGLLATVMFSIQFLFALRFSKQIHELRNSSALSDGIKGFLLYFAAHSLVTGRFAHYSEFSFFMIALLGCTVFEARRRLITESSTSERVSHAKG